MSEPFEEYEGADLPGFRQVIAVDQARDDRPTIFLTDLDPNGNVRICMIPSQRPRLLGLDSGLRRNDGEKT